MQYRNIYMLLTAFRHIVHDIHKYIYSPYFRIALFYDCMVLLWCLLFLFVRGFSSSLLFPFCYFLTLVFDIVSPRHAHKSNGTMRFTQFKRNLFRSCKCNLYFLSLLDIVFNYKHKDHTSVNNALRPRKLANG